MFVSALPDPTCNSEIQRNLRMVEINKYYYYYYYYYHDIKFNQQPVLFDKEFLKYIKT